MINQRYAKDLLASLFSPNTAHSLSEIKQWIADRKKKTTIQIEKISLDELRGWHTTDTGEIVHDSGGFFSIDGVRVKTNWGFVADWDQPIINQPEIGILGFLATTINGVLHLLVQAKIEPGNINGVQIGPTLQATKSNLTRRHGGKKPRYADYFTATSKHLVILDQLQSEQGGRFLKKRNRNMIVQIDKIPPTHPDYRWVTLGQLKRLMRLSNVVNMDARTVISCIDFGSFSTQVLDIFKALYPVTKLSDVGKDLAAEK